MIRDWLGAGAIGETRFRLEATGTVAVHADSGMVEVSGADGGTPSLLRARGAVDVGVHDYGWDLAAEGPWGPSIYLHTTHSERTFFRFSSCRACLPGSILAIF